MLRTVIFAAGLVVAAPSLAQSEPAGDYAEVNGMRMYYEVSGEGEPIVVLPGAHMNIITMGRIIPLLAEAHKVYALEFQGHGRTNDIDRPITYENLADDVAAFMDAVGLERADIFGYSMGAGAGLQLSIRHPDKVGRLVAASMSYSSEGWQPVFQEMIPQMSLEMFAQFEEQWKSLAPNPDGYEAFIDRMIALEHEEFDWQEGVAALEIPVLLITSDADVTVLEHSVELFRLLGGGIMGDMGQPLPKSRLAVLPATSHTAIITQTDLLMGFIEPFLKDETPKGFFEQ
ncbi:alpha/beta hydrolase [Devosia sp. 919]|uniref:alpha/beta fold hydrolase n=1 Tax=Devosia sp. 919 TaxID=2726065 RepID=UPI001552C36E|nr:alpha/beta hydrolase [Devosia sp. 919]